MANTFVKAMGGQTGASLVEDDLLDTARGIIQEAEAKGVKLHIPTDAVVADAFAETANTDQCAANAVPDGWMALDIGPKSIEACRAAILRSRTLLWNGPMGVFEKPPFDAGTHGVAEAMAKATANGATTIIGGGDSAAAVAEAGLESQMSHVSTGGGASLEFLEGKDLPGVSALDAR
jgi:phosphoglycerate kinase